jgi:glycyl-tRNA synthetase beta chain
MAEFLFEIGLEEVPARMIAGAQAELAKKITETFSDLHLFNESTKVESFSTPRRLAVRVAGMREKQEDESRVEQGPAVKIAYSKDGNPTPAAHAFAKKFGVDVADLKVKSTPKGDYLEARFIRRGLSAADLIVQEMPYILSSIYWAKNMTWRPGRPERFVRPVRWMVCLLGEVVVPVEFGGKTAGKVTRGHRVLAGDEAIAIGFPDEYEQTLLDAHVVADVEKRRLTISKALDKATRVAGTGLRWREDEALVDTVTHLTEWPTVVLGSFEPEYLKLPEEVLVTVMRDHQKYFAVEDATGKLAPHFLAVLNTAADAAGEAVIRHGNERVLRARFNDARFFWEFDQRVPLAERVELLEKVTFQKDLGSYAAKAVRVRRSCEWMANVLSDRGLHIDQGALLLAADIAKTDLTTELVKEFTELQGEIGGLYAIAQGLPQAVADAIYDQYRPVSTEDRIPRTTEGQVLALADKADTIAGMFGLGLEPTGSKDPFALRRAANGIIKILAEAKIPLDLEEIPTMSVGFGSPDVVNRMIVFLFERVEFYLRDVCGFAYDVVKAVLSPKNEATMYNNVPDAVARAEAVTAVRGSDDFAAVSAAFKRMKNILAQAAEKGEVPHASAETSGFQHPAEIALMLKEEEIADLVKKAADSREYVSALEVIATLRPEVDEFFDQVMVMDPDPKTRNNRLWLLQRILRNFSGIADFSEIVTAG